MTSREEPPEGGRPHQGGVPLPHRPGRPAAHREALRFRAPADGGRNIALIFEKASTRTRCAFEVGAHDQGAHVTYLGPEGSHIGVGESIKDTARVLGRMFDGIEYRGFAQESVETWPGSPGCRCGTG
jgi:ornithine carbamoyltransferase